MAINIISAALDDYIKLEEKMRKTLITLSVAVILVVPGFTGWLFAGENIARSDAPVLKPIAVSEESSGAEKMDKGEAKAAEGRKAEEAKQAEEERKAVEEAKKNIVARVNGADINMFMLTRAMNRVAPKYIKEAPTPETTAKIRDEALNRLIFEELAVQEAIKQDINPAPEAIEKVVDQVRKNLGPGQDYREYLVNNNLTEDTLKKLIERSQRHEIITAREVYRKVKVDEKLLQDEYEKEKGKYILPENLVVDDVWFMNLKDDAARKKAEEVLNTIKRKDNDFGKLMLDGTFIVRKIKVKKEKYPEIHKAMAGMKVGDLSGVISDKDGLHIIKVSKNEPSRQATFEEARGTIEPKFLVPAQEQRTEEWEKELRKNAKIEISKNSTLNGRPYADALSKENK